MRNLGGIERLKATPLVRANSTFFPQTQAEGHARAEYGFELIERHMGMADWRCELQAYERLEPNVRVAEHAFVRSPLASIKELI